MYFRHCKRCFILQYIGIQVVATDVLTKLLAESADDGDS